MSKYTHGKLLATDLLAEDVACPVGKYTYMGAYTVKAGEVIFPGYGAAQNLDDAVGRIYMKFQKAGPTEVKGEVQLAILSPQDIPLYVYGTWRTEDLNTDASNKTLQLPFPKSDIGLSKDKKLALYFKSDTADTIDVSICTILMDITRVLLD
jgi:hypothetical protein